LHDQNFPDDRKPAANSLQLDFDRLSISSSVATSTVDLKTVHHANDRMFERNVSYRSLQHLRKHQSRNSKWSHHGRRRFEGAGVTMITNARANRVISTWPTHRTSYPAYEKATQCGDQSLIQARHSDIMANLQVDRYVKSAVVTARSQELGSCPFLLQDRRLNKSQLAIELAFDQNMKALHYLLEAYPFTQEAQDSKGRRVTHILFRHGLLTEALSLAAQYPSTLGLNTQSGDGNTLLTYCGATRNKELFYRLTSLGCDPFLRNTNGHSPLSKLLKNERFVTVRLRFQGTQTYPEERWVPCAAVSIPGHDSQEGTPIGDSVTLAPVCPQCTVLGHHAESPLLRLQSRLAQPLEQHLVSLVLEYVGVGSRSNSSLGYQSRSLLPNLLGHSDEETQSLPSLEAHGWHCAWCGQALSQRVFCFSRFGSDDDDMSDYGLSDSDCM
jgi:hypothetical protein